MKGASPNQRSDQPVATPKPMSRCRIFWTLVFPTMLFAGAISQYVELPDYYAGINSVSGLDPTTDLARCPALLYPEFNLTFRVSSHTPWLTKCVEPGTYMGVAYGGVWFATTVPTTERICVGPGKMVDRPFVARGREVVMPVSVQDSLVGKLRGGLLDFDVVFLGLEQCWALSCGQRRVGDTDVLQTRCSNYIRTCSRRYANAN